MRPWLLQLPWLPTPRQARDEMISNRSALGEEQFWDEIWTQRDVGQDAVRVRSSGAWPWTQQRSLQLRELTVAPIPFRRQG